MKKILSIIFVTLCIFQMVVLATGITIGYPAIEERTNVFTSGYTIICLDVPANESGKIISVEIWAASTMYNTEVATYFLESGSNYTTRDSEAIGTVTEGAKRTIPINLDVEAGDFIGVYYTGGNVKRDTTGFQGVCYVLGDNVPCEDVTFTVASDDAISLYGTGATEEEVNALFWFNF